MREPLRESGSDLARSFSSPPDRARPLLAWRWNAAFQSELLCLALDQARVSGHQGVVLRPTAAMPAAYPSPQWTQFARAYLLECRTRQLRAYLGDDVGRSGSAGGHIAARHPELASYALHFRTQDLPTAALGSYSPDLEGTLLSASATPLVMDGRPDYSSSVSLLIASGARDVAQLHKVAANVRLHAFAAQQDGYADILNPATGELFVHLVHEDLRRALGLDSSQLAGFWSRGVTLQPGALEASFPWSPVLPTVFESAYGYDLREWLAALVANTGDEAARLRQEYWESVAGLVQISFWEVVSEWIGARRLEWYGTFQGPPTLNAMLAQVGDPTVAHAALSAPTISADLAQRDSKEGGITRRSTVGARLAASVAILAGQERVVAEFGAGLEWGTTLGERTQTLHELLYAGANHFLLGECAPSLFGAQDAPGPDSLAADVLAENTVSETHQPYWEAWQAWATYAARSGHALAQGRSGANVGVLWPARSAQAHFYPGGHRYTRWVEEDLEATATLLDRAHFEYLILPEDLLSDAIIEGAVLHCGTAHVPLEMLVLPSVTALSWAAWRKIEAWVQVGGKVVCLGLLPRWSERGRDQELEAAISARARLNIEDVYDSYTQQERGNTSTTVGYPMTREESSGGRFCCYQPRLNPDADDAFLRAGKLLREALPPRAETQTPGLVVSSRILPDGVAEEDERFTPGGDLFWIVNTSDETQRGNVLLRPSHPQRRLVPHELDGWTGALTLRPVYTPYREEEGGGLSIAVQLSAGEGKLFWLRPPARAEAESHIERATFRVESWNGSIASGYALEEGVPQVVVRLPDGGLRRHSGEEVEVPDPIMLEGAWQATRRGPNVLILNEWQWTRSRGGGLRSLMSEAGRGEGWQKLPPRLSPNGGLEIGVERQLVAMGGLALRTTFRVSEAAASLWLCLRAPDAPHRLSLNGEPLETQGTPYEEQPLWRDSGWSWYSLERARLGDNTLLCELDAAIPAYNGQRLAPGIARIVGDFHLDEDYSIWPTQSLRLEPGSWHAQGLPFYSGAVDYKQWVNVPAKWNNCRVFLELSRMRDACGLWLNERSCGVKIAAPYRFDVSKLILRGSSNEVRLRVWNTAEAALEGHTHSPLPSGLLGPARFVAYPIVYPSAE